MSLLAPPLICLGDRRLYTGLVQFPVVCFCGALVSDIAYWRTANFLWETFSVWLLAAGCLLAGVCGVVGIILFIRDARLRQSARARRHASTSLLAAVLAVVNAFVHSRDGFTAVVPDGLVLSTIVVLLMLLATWWGRASAERGRNLGVAA